MLGYNKQKRANFFHIEVVEKWRNRKWITDQEFKNLSDKLMPRYEHSNIFVNIGLFILTVIIISAGLGLIVLLFHDAIDFDNFWFSSLLTASLLFFLLQKFVIGDKNQFRTGADDAMLYASMLFAFGFFFFLFEDSIFDSGISVSLFFIIFFGVPAVIYLDRLLTAMTVFSLLAFLFFLLFKLGNTAAMFIPFVMMVISAAGYFISTKKMLTAKNKAIEECIEIIYWISIGVFYLSGNYWVVIELSNELGLGSAFPLPIQLFLYAFTIVVPLLYIYFGLKRKEMSLLNAGLGAVAISVLTIRYYHQLLSIEYALILGGMVLLGVAYAAMKYWAIERNGITLEPDEDVDSGLKLESLIIAESFGKSEVDSGFEGQGGEFGGGGASGDF
jgi:hypothetical protein